MLAAGCNSGGGPGTAPAAVPGVTTSGQLETRSIASATKNVAFAVAFKPKAAAGRNGPQFLSPSTASLRILVDGANPVVINLAASSPNCAPDPNAPGSYICRAGFGVSAGNHVFTVTAYDAPGGSGSVLSTNSTGVVYVKPVGQTFIALTLEGAVAHVILTLATTNPPVGQPATLPLTATLEDADQNLIVGPAAYNNPVTLTTTDALDGALSKTLLHSPADAAGLTVNYTGAGVASIIYSATANGLPGANVIPAVLAPGARSQHLYRASLDGSILEYDLGDLAAAPVTITGPGITSPNGFAFDPSGKLYVVNAADNTIGVIDTVHQNKSLAILSGNGLALPWNAVVGTDGKLYVTNTEQGSVNISVFDTLHGYAPLPPIMLGGGLAVFGGLALDAQGRLYVGAFEFPAGARLISVLDTTHGDAPLPPIVGGGLGYPNGAPAGLTVDASGKLYVATNNGGGTILIFDTAHANTPLTPITGGGLLTPDGLALDAQARLYATNTFVNYLSVFDTAHGNIALPPLNDPRAPSQNRAIGIR